MKRSRRAGFSLVELLVAIVLGSVLIGAGWKLMKASSSQGRQLKSIGELATISMEVDATLSSDIQEAGRGLFGMPNIGPINVQLDNVSPDTLDALIILKPPMLDNQESPDTTVWRVSSQSCPPGSPSNCFLVVGNATATLTPNQLMIVGSPTLGGHIVSVVSASVVNQPCILDCNKDFIQAPDDTTASGAVAWTGWGGSRCSFGSCNDLTSTPTNANCGPRVFQSMASAATDTLSIAQYIYSPDTAVKCPPGVLKASAPNSSAPQAASVTTSQGTFTSIVFQIQTQTFGYPQMATALFKSGANNLPITYAQRVEAFRYYVDSDPSRYRVPTLIRQSGWLPNGQFNINAPVIPNIRWLAIETRQTPVMAATSDAADNPNYVRQVIATSATLSLSSNNRDEGPSPCATSNNWRRETVPSDSAKVSGWRFCRSYASLTGVRIRYRTASVYRLEGESRPDSAVRSYATTVATPNVAQGGAVITP